MRLLIHVNFADRHAEKLKRAVERVTRIVPSLPGFLDTAVLDDLDLFDVLSM